MTHKCLKRIVIWIHREVRDISETQKNYLIVVRIIAITYLLAYLFTPWNRVLLEKLTGFQLNAKFATFMESEGLLEH
jgi:hypothetical protein